MTDLITVRSTTTAERDVLRPLRLGLSLLGLFFLAASFVPNHGFDLHAYWMVTGDPYAHSTDALNAYGSFWYAPPIAMLMAPLSMLTWEALVIGWLAIQLAALAYVGRGWALALIVFPPVWLDIVYGNINILLGAMIVAGFRHPAVWSFALLTKVTPAVGLVWFAVRRDWLALAHVAVATAVLSLASIPILGADLWSDWIAIVSNAGRAAVPSDALPIPLFVRLVLAGSLVAWAARTDRQWLVPIGVVLAMPLLWPIAFAPLIAIAALLPEATRARLRHAIARFIGGPRTGSGP